MITSPASNRTSSLFCQRCFINSGKSVDPDQTALEEQSDLSLHSFLWLMCANIDGEYGKNIFQFSVYHILVFFLKRSK